MKRYLNLNGISWVLDGDTDRAMGVRPLAQKMMHVMKMQNVNNLDHVWYTHRMDDGTVIRVESLFGKDRAYVYCDPPPPVSKGRVKEKRTEYIVPAIEVFDVTGAFVGLVVCVSGTFEPPYVLVRLPSYGQETIDPFNWNQWRYYYETRPFTERTERVLIYSAGQFDEVYDIPCTGEYLATTGEDNYQYATTGTIPSWEIEIPCCDDWYEYSGVHGAIGMLIGYLDVDSTYTYAYDCWVSIADDNLDPDPENKIVGENLQVTHRAIKDYNTVVFDNSAVGGLGINPSDPSDCPGIVAKLSTYIDQNYDDPTSPPLRGPGDKVSGTLEDIVRHDTFMVDENFDSTLASNYESTKKGGMIVGLWREDNVEFITVVDNLTSLPVCQMIYLVHSADDGPYWVMTQTETDNSTWKEGVIVDGTFYEHDSGLNERGYAYYYDYELRYLKAGYWDIPYGIIFMGSGLRDTSNVTTYFHVNHSAGAMTVTDFNPTGTQFLVGSDALKYGNSKMHEIPGFDEVFGNGCFRLLRIVEEEKEVIE